MARSSPLLGYNEQEAKHTRHQTYIENKKEDGTKYIYIYKMTKPPSIT